MILFFSWESSDGMDVGIDDGDDNYDADSCNILFKSLSLADWCLLVDSIPFRFKLFDNISFIDEDKKAPAAGIENERHTFLPISNTTNTTMRLCLSSH